MNTKMTLPKQNLVLTLTDRTEIDKVLQALVGKVNIYEKLPSYLSSNCRYRLYYSLDYKIIIVNSEVPSNSILCDTADEFLAHFEKPKFIEIELEGVKATVFDTYVTFSTKIENLSTEELNQIVEAQKQLI